MAKIGPDGLTAWERRLLELVIDHADTLENRVGKRYDPIVESAIDSIVRGVRALRRHQQVRRGETDEQRIAEIDRQLADLDVEPPW